jgi:uncharacterized protein (DUF169 family)
MFSEEELICITVPLEEDEKRKSWKKKMGTCQFVAKKRRRGMFYFV